MIFTVEQYEAMRSVAQRLIKSKQNISIDDARALNFEYDALMSLYGQLFVRNLKVEIRQITEAKLQNVVRRVTAGESLLEVATEFNVGSLKFAKLYLEASGYKNIQISALMLEPYQIKDKRIREELLKLMELDPISSHEIELLKESLGREYEELLIKLLHQKHMCFETESELRARGKPKTPDILFSIPMAVRLQKHDLQFMHEQGSNLFGSVTESPIEGSHMLPSDQNNHLVINWIDSKAMFADAVTFKENLEQFRAYNHRYGRGMVIYWHGYVADICDGLPDDMIIVRDRFPDSWVFPTGEPADGRRPAFDFVDLHVK
jgi:CDAN1-interacting nuclease 1